MQDKKNKQSPLGLINTEDSSCWNAFLGDSHIFQKKLEHCEHCHIHFVFLILFQSISFFQHFLNMTSLPDADLCILRIAFSESWPLHPYDPKLHLLQRMHHEFIYIYIYISTVWNGILMTFACFWDIFSRIFCCFFFWIFWKVVVPFSRVLACKILWYLFTWGQIHPRFLATTAQMQAKQCSGAGAERWNGSTDQRFSYFCSSVFNTSHISSVCFAFPFSKPLLGSAKEDVVITQMSLIAAMLDPEASQLLSSRSWTLQSSCAFSAFIRFNWFLLAAGKLHFPGESLSQVLWTLATDPTWQSKQSNIVHLRI